VSTFGKWNHYKCPKCGGVTVARHDTEGVTPFLLRCRARDQVVNGYRIPGCKELAESTMFTGPQEDTQAPHVIFYRPNAAEAMNIIDGEPQRDRAWLLHHYNLGGALMREV